MKQTAVQWLIEQLKEHGQTIPEHLDVLALEKENSQTKEFVEKVAFNGWYVLHRAYDKYQWLSERSNKNPRVIITTDELLKRYFYE